MSTKSEYPDLGNLMRPLIHMLRLSEIPHVVIKAGVHINKEAD